MIRPSVLFFAVISAFCLPLGASPPLAHAASRTPKPHVSAPAAKNKTTNGESSGTVTCASAKETMDILAQQLHQVPIWGGQTADGNGLIVTQNPNDGSWTLLLIIKQNGEIAACIVNGGAKSALASGQKPSASADDGDHPNSDGQVNSDGEIHL